MKKISDIISKELFINAFHICKAYVNNTYINDINLLILKDYFNSLTENNISKYYDEYIQNEIFYTIPYLFGTEVVTIPKNINGLREYRYFTIMSMILYNAIGLLFVDICSEFIKDVKFKNENVFRFSPTNFFRIDKGTWKAKNEYPRHYKEFSDKMKELVDNNSIILKVDISNYFETINHKKLIELIKTFGLESKLAIYDFDEKAEKALEFYFESVMKMKCGIPQGKTNCVSDLYGEIYLMPFDLNIKSICQNHNLSYKAMIRYVDDIMIIMENKNEISEREIIKDVSLLEQEISNFLYNNLGLKLNPKKTEFKILRSQNMKSEFINANIKKVSNPNNIDEKKVDISKEEIKEQFENFIITLQKYKFENNLSPNIQFEDRENLKVIFSKSIKSYLKKPENQKLISNIIKDLDYELTVNEINIIITIFYLKNKQNINIYNQYLIEFLKNNLNLKDKRIIHIILLMLTQEKLDKSLIKSILSQKEILLTDNYGRYILLLLKEFDYNENLELLDDMSIYNELNYEYRKRKANYIRNYFGTNITLYNSFLVKLKKSNLINECIIFQLKLFVSCYRIENWDSAFNHFENIFHELCKNKYHLNDDSTVNDIISKLYKDDIISTNEEIILRKFYDRRNFNPISHPSKNGKSAVKISKEALMYYKDDILKIMLKIMN